MMHIRIESALAAAWNREIAENPPVVATVPRAETWEGILADDLNLEEIFRFFNRVGYGDAGRLDKIGYDLPSLSVGDYVTKNGKRYRVEPVGFVEAAEQP
jgi:hypothetical protein